MTPCTFCKAVATLLYDDQSGYDVCQACWDKHHLWQSIKVLSSVELNERFTGYVESITCAFATARVTSLNDQEVARAFAERIGRDVLRKRYYGLRESGVIFTMGEVSQLQLSLF